MLANMMILRITAATQAIRRADASCCFVFFSSVIPKISFFVVSFRPFLSCNSLLQTLTQQERTILKQMKMTILQLQNTVLGFDTLQMAAIPNMHFDSRECDVT